jgi:polysaccharide biosynthesis transport protein
MTEKQDSLELSKILSILKRKKWLILLCLIGALTPVIIYNHITPLIYEASTTIVFEEKPGATTSMNPFRISWNKDIITNQMEEIRSYSLSEEVVKTLPITIVNSFPVPQNISSESKKTVCIAKQIQKGILTSSVPNSDVIKIKVQAYSSVGAEVITNTITEVLKQRNLEVRREETSNVRKIIEEQLVTFKKQLDESEIALKNFKESSKVTVIDREAEEIFRRITEAEITYNQAKANYDAASKRLIFIQEKLKKERADLVPSITKITSPWAQKLKEQLVELEVQYTTLKVQNYTEDHPKMQELQKQIEQTKQNLKDESLKIASGENIVDPISQIQKYMEESINLEIEIQTYRAQETTLQEVIDNYKRNLNTMPDKELRLAQLLRNKEVSEKIFMTLSEKREEAKIAEAEKVGNIRIIDPATVPPSPIKPKKILNLLVAIILGTSIGIVMSLVLDFFDNSIKTAEEAEKLVSLSVIGTIPKLRISKPQLTEKIQNNMTKMPDMTSRLITNNDPKSPESESFRTLRTNLQFSAIDSPKKLILVTSPNPSEGKSFIIANLSITTAQMGLKTLLIDADLRKPVAHYLFQKKREPGLIDVLVHSRIPKNKNEGPTTNGPEQSENLIATKSEDSFNINSLNDNLNDLEYLNLKTSLKKVISATHIPNLDLLTCGSIPPNPSEILGSKAIHKLMLELKNQYDTIFIDAPPINIVTDAGVLATIVDGALLIIKAGQTEKQDVKIAKNLLQKANCNILGIIINYVSSYDEYSKYYNYYYNDDNSNGKQKKKKQLVKEK